MNYAEYKDRQKIKVKIKTPLYFDTKNEEIVIEKKKDIKRVVEILEYALQEYKTYEKISNENRLKESKQLKDFTKDKILTCSKFGNPIWINKQQ